MLFDSNGWLDEAIEIGYSDKSMDRQGHKITHICLHGTAGGSSAQAIGKFFQDPNVAASAHFVIGQDGAIVQGIPLSLGAWGNGFLSNGHASYLPENVNPNLYTASIEHVKTHTDNSDALTDIQAKKSFELILCICNTYGVPKRAGDANGGIIRHADIDPVNRERCPGPYPWDQLWAFLNSGGNIAKYREQAALDTWNSTAYLFGGTPLPYDTGIAQSWRNTFVNKAINMPPPTTREFRSVDWNGNSIVVQFFGTVRCEWDANSQAHWFNTGV